MSNIYLPTEDRLRLTKMKASVYRFIAKMLEKSSSTISRELKRNSVTQMDSSYAVYIADTAHILYKKRRQKCIYRKYDPLFFVGSKYKKN